MNPTKALSQLGFVTGRGLDNGELGALLLSNKVEYLGSYFILQYNTTQDNPTNSWYGGKEKMLHETRRNQNQG